MTVNANFMTGYTETIRHWVADNRRAGILTDADGTGEMGLDSEERGSRLAVRFTLKLQCDRVLDLRYQVFGCGFTVAACAVAADMAVGCQLDLVRQIDAQKLALALEGLPAERSYCVELAAAALQAAVTSALNNRTLVAGDIDMGTEHGSRVGAKDLCYATLIDSFKPYQVTRDDRHLFACLIAVALQDGPDPAAALGLKKSDLARILENFFPAVEQDSLSSKVSAVDSFYPQLNSDILAILLSYLPNDVAEQDLPISIWLAHILAARAAHPGHLWVAMGLSERPQLSAAIRRHLPALAAANRKNMRWKRYLYKQLCDQNGGTLCKAPNCGVCSDYALCFAED